MENPEEAETAVFPDGVWDVVVAERYGLGRRLGGGSASDVYEAWDTVLARPVAVKVLRVTGIEDSDEGTELSVRFLEETRLLTLLDHRNLMPLYDAGVDADGRRFLVMPRIPGPTLGDLIRRGPVEPDLVRRIGAGLADVLAHLHAAGVVHRDVKPGNVLLDPGREGGVYLTDLGIAQAWDGPVLTAAGFVVGTAGYLAPEQARGQSAGPAADVYALGLVLLEALTGEREYTGTPMERAIAGAVRPPEIPGTVGPRWQAVLSELMAHDPDQRPSALDVRNLLSGADARDGRVLRMSRHAGRRTHVEPDPVRTARRPALTPHRRRALSAGLGLAALSGIAALAVVGGAADVGVTSPRSPATSRPTPRDAPGAAAPGRPAEGGHPEPTPAASGSPASAGMVPVGAVASAPAAPVGPVAGHSDKRSHGKHQK